MDAKSRELVFHYILAEQARRTPDKACLVTHERELSYREVERQSNRWARGFARLGVSKGDRVLVMLPSGIEHVLVWLGLCKIGALIVPVNEAYRGNMLRHQAHDSGAALALVDAQHLPRWGEIAADLTDLRSIAVYPNLEGAVENAPWTLLSAAIIPDADDAPVPPAVGYQDAMAIFYTSGTTGPSKGVLYTYAQAHATALPVAGLLGTDGIFYMFLPMFHVGLSQLFGAVVVAGGTMALRDRFSGRNFWPDLRHFRATLTILLSTMPHFLLSQPPSPEERAHALRGLIMIPLLKDLAAFKQRFGCEVTTFYNMTEVSVPLCANGYDLVDGLSCGRPRPGIRARIVDERDEPVPTGEVGELVLRADNAWEFNLGYWRNPEKTVEAWRNQWLHTGDAFRADLQGNYYFVDRLKDAIRRRGENISSFEVEAEVEAHPAILECAAVAVPTAAGEDEVMVVATVKPGARLEPIELHAFLVGRLPKYMLPRFIELHGAELPKTPTGKIRKAALREAGTENAWDREGGPV